METRLRLQVEHTQTHITMSSQHPATIHQLLKAHIMCSDVGRSRCLQQHQTHIHHSNTTANTSAHVSTGKMQIKMKCQITDLKLKFKSFTKI